MTKQPKLLICITINYANILLKYYRVSSLSQMFIYDLNNSKKSQPNDPIVLDFLPTGHIANDTGASINGPQVDYMFYPSFLAKQVGFGMIFQIQTFALLMKLLTNTPFLVLKNVNNLHIM